MLIDISTIHKLLGIKFYFFSIKYPKPNDVDSKKESNEYKPKLNDKKASVVLNCDVINPCFLGFTADVYIKYLECDFHLWHSHILMWKDDNFNENNI